MTPETERRARATRAQRQQRAAFVFWLTVLAVSIVFGPVLLYLAVRLVRLAWGS